VRRRLVLHNSRSGWLIEILLVIRRVFCRVIGFSLVRYGCMYVGCVSLGQAYYNSGLVYGFVWEYRVCKSYDFSFDKSHDFQYLEKIYSLPTRHIPSAMVDPNEVLRVSARQGRMNTMPGSRDKDIAFHVRLFHGVRYSRNRRNNGEHR